jgi:hypothetical protein
MVGTSSSSSPPTEIHTYTSSILNLKKRNKIEGVVNHRTSLPSAHMGWLKKRKKGSSYSVCGVMKEES